MGGVVSCLEPGSSAAFLHAAIDGDLEEITLRVERDPTLLTHHGVALKDTAWHLASAYGRIEVLNHLLHLLTEHEAAVSQRLASKRQLDLSQTKPLEHILVNQLNSKGQTPLMFACYSAQPETVKYLISKVKSLCASIPAVGIRR